MAVDTRDKRFSIMDIGGVTTVALPNPAAAFQADDRVQLLEFYSGFLAGAGGGSGRNKRFSMMGLSRMFEFVGLPNPDGTIDATDRVHLLALYSGFATPASSPRRSHVSWAELEVPNSPVPEPRRGQVSWTEFEVPSLTALRRALVSQVEFILVSNSPRYRANFRGGMQGLSGGFFEGGFSGQRDHR